MTPKGQASRSLVMAGGHQSGNLVPTHPLIRGQTSLNGFSKIEFRGDDVSLRILWGDIMGVRSIEICKRKALELWCDGAAHGPEWRTAWFDCGSDFGNFAVATAPGWSELSGAEQVWLCPQCARKNALQSDHSHARIHIDEFVAEEEAA
jgi:hypothetical protein